MEIGNKSWPDVCHWAQNVKVVVTPPRFAHQKSVSHFTFVS